VVEVGAVVEKGYIEVSEEMVDVNVRCFPRVGAVVEKRRNAK
jgi:hypothetical protein